MPLVVLQKIFSPPPGQGTKYEKGWTYVERRPRQGIELRRTTRSRAPSPEPQLLSRLSIEDHYYWHGHKDNHHYSCAEPIIIDRSPKTKPSPPANPPAPPPKPNPSPSPAAVCPAPTTDPAAAAGAADIDLLRARLTVAEEARNKADRDAREARQRSEERLFSAPHFPSYSSRERAWQRDRDWRRQRAKERERERHCERERERERERAREYERKQEHRRQRKRAQELEYERDRDRQRQRERGRDRDRGRLRRHDPVRQISPSSSSSSSSSSICPFQQRRHAYPTVFGGGGGGGCCTCGANCGPRFPSNSSSHRCRTTTTNTTTTTRRRTEDLRRGRYNGRRYCYDFLS